MAHYSRILVPVDFSDHSAEALQQARDVAGRFNAELHLVTVVEQGPPAGSMTAELYPLYRDFVLQEEERATTHLRELVASIAGSTQIQHSVLKGHIQHEIVKYIEANGIDLVVLGTQGRTGLAHWLLGSVAERVARFAPCSVLIARKRTADPSPANQ